MVKETTIDGLARMVQRGFGEVTGSMARKDEMDKRFDEVDKSFDKIEDRLERSEKLI